MTDTSMRCDQCKHWLPEPDQWEANGVGFRECGAVRARWVIQDEASERMTRKDVDLWLAARVEALKSSRAYVQDGSEYRAELFTAQDFFCALFDRATTADDGTAAVASSCDRHRCAA